MGQGVAWVRFPTSTWPMVAGFLTGPNISRTGDIHDSEELQAQVHSMDGAKGWFERRLKEAGELVPEAALKLV